VGICSSDESRVQAIAKTDRESYVASKAVDAELDKVQSQQKNVAKLLLLGAGESGKSTLFKQMRVIYGPGFTEESRKTFRSVVHQNVIRNIKSLLEASDVLSRKGIAGCAIPAALGGQVREVHELKENDWLDEKLAHSISSLWLSDPLQHTWAHRNLFQLSDSAGYFLDKVLELGVEGYTPSEQDVFRVRVRTKGIVEDEFVIDSNTINIYDVGGQRSERKKWIHCFNGVTAVLFVAALNEYDMVLEEAPDTNRMEEGLNLFESICNSRWFRDTHMILLLNKRDLFQEKLPVVPLNQYWPEYKGANEYDPATAFIRAKFEAQNKNPRKYIYTHFTCATDTRNCKIVFEAVKHIVITTSLKGVGLAT